MHFLFLISENANMCFQTELLMRSILYFSPHGSDTKFSVIVNGDKSGPIKNPLKIINHKLKNSFINKHAEVLSCEYHWLVPAPSRWFINPRCKSCVFIDVDMIACRNLFPLYNLKKNFIYGVNSIKIPMNQKEWERLGFFSKSDFKYYFNFGMLVVPSYLMLKIGNMLMTILPVILQKFKKYEYFAAQIALACVLKKLKIKKIVLPRNFNYVDTPNHDDDNFDDILFLHYVHNRKYYKNFQSHLTVEENVYTKKINEIIKKIY